MKDSAALRKKLAELMSEHRVHDAEIVRTTNSGDLDQVEIQRLKKRKLALKDQIKQIENKLLPDIIA